MTARRALHLVVAGIAAVLTLPILLVAGLAVAATLGQPVVFVQARSGRGGVRFLMTKLRTMTDACDVWGQPLPDAQRLTPLGRFLRRSRIDELPGLWHVLNGEMALVGPRPLLPAAVQAMGWKGIERGRVAPGLTGWAQVHGNALLGDQDKLALDLWYIQHASLWLDLTILMKTAGVVLLGEQVDRDAVRRAYAGRYRRGG